MNLIIWVYLAVASWPNTFAMYYTTTREIFQPPTSRHLQNNSYFGYSITYDKSYKNLVISAPRENDIGEVYNCNLENKACTPIVKNVKRVLADYKHDYWFGATVKAGQDFVMMCAPRFIENNKYKSAGTCFSYANGNLTRKETINETERFADTASDKNQLAMDTFGWSIDVASDDSIIVGGPGMFHGRAMIYKNILDKNPTFIKKSNHTPEFNFGYAVASGYFINEKLSYAVGSPYGTLGYGEVALYEGLNFKENLNNPLKYEHNMGSMFGAVLCAASLFGNRTDLLVGAPTYATPMSAPTQTKITNNLGAVYVYLALTVNSKPVFKRKIVGKVSGSMFGSAIVNVGDLNGDEKHEIAIGAPFEKDGHGVVYLYNGADLISELTEWDLKCLQRIEPETSYGESFGMSLTALLDYDENGCNELAIGSPYKDTVVVLRCLATVVVETSVNFPNLQDRGSNTDFKFKVCLSVKYPTLPKKIIAHISTTVELDHKYAKLTDVNDKGHFTYSSFLHKNETVYCKNVSFTLPLVGKYDTKISYTISSKLIKDPRILSDFNSSRVILSDRSILKIQGSVWATECAGTKNKTCVPKLTLTPYISFLHDEDPYIIGSSKTETMNFTVHNDGEVAYESCVRVHINGAHVLTTPTGCVHEALADRNRLLCEPPRPIRTNEIWNSGQIVLEMTHLTNLDESIFINMLLFDRCEDVITKNNSNTIQLKADHHGITIKGETDIGPIVNVTKTDIEKNGKKLQHVYTIKNKGLTNWKQLQVQVTLQMYSYIKYDTDTPVTVNYPVLDLYTRCPSQNGTSKSYVCVVESLIANGEFPSIHIPMYIVPGTLGGIINKDKNATIMSSIKLQFADDDDEVNKSVTTTITLLEAPPVPLLTIIIALVVGLCIIIVIALILYRVGFLRRKNKEKLAKLKNHVKRQTIMRNSLRQSHGPAGDERRSLVEKQRQQGQEINEAFKSNDQIKPKK